MGHHCAAMHSANALEPLLITVSHGAPRIHVINLRLMGRLRVEGGELQLSDCIIEPSSTAGEPDSQGHTSATADQRALSITGGHVVLLRTLLAGHAAGAVEVASARLTLIGSAIRQCRAHHGGAMLVHGSSDVVVERSNITDNVATVRGGALQVQSLGRISCAAVCTSVWMLCPSLILLVRVAMPRRSRAGGCACSMQRSSSET